MYGFDQRRSTLHFLGFQLPGAGEQVRGQSLPGTHFIAHHGHCCLLMDYCREENGPVGWKSRNFPAPRDPPSCTHKNVYFPLASQAIRVFIFVVVRRRSPFNGRITPQFAPLIKGRIAEHFIFSVLFFLYLHIYKQRDG